MNGYVWMMAAGTVLIFLLYGLRCALAVRVPALKKNAWPAALLSLFFSAAFGIILARISYAVLMQELDFEYDGIEALEQLLSFEIDCVSFFGGALGVVLGTALANRLTRKGSVLAGLDAFAPFGALLTALFRLGEIGFGSYGAGEMLSEGSPFAFFPVALKISADGGYTYYALAVCVISALFALIWAAVSFFKLRSTGRTGLNFTASLFFLALPQILCESLRRRGMFWLFVHVEEVLCALVLLGVLLYWILKTRREMPFFVRWAPMLVFIVGAGLIAVTEFAIDGKLFDFSDSVCYLFMSVVLILIGAAGIVAVKRWNSEK